MSRLDHKMLPAPPEHLLFTLHFLVGPSRNRISFCYNDERAGCWWNGSFGKALYTHTHVHSHTTHPHNPLTTHTLASSTHIYTYSYTLHRTLHTHNPHPTHKCCIQAALHSLLTLTLYTCYTLLSPLATSTQEPPTVVSRAKIHHKLFGHWNSPMHPFLWPFPTLEPSLVSLSPPGLLS